MATIPLLVDIYKPGPGDHRHVRQGHPKGQPHPTQCAVRVRVLTAWGGLHSAAHKQGAQGVPAAWPCKEIVPEFNALAFFNVLPGRSYHAVQVRASACSQTGQVGRE